MFGRDAEAQLIRQALGRPWTHGAHARLRFAPHEDLEASKGTNILGDQKKGLRAPVTAIRNGETDGNPATTGDPTWSSFIVTPPFPDYVSGHATFSGAAAKVLALFYGTDAIAFTTGSDFLPGVTRSFTSCSGAAAEAAVSRIYGGHSLPLRERGRDGVGCAHRRLGLRQHAAAEGEQVEEVAAAQRRSA